MPASVSAYLNPPLRTLRRSKNISFQLVLGILNEPLGSLACAVLVEPSCTIGCALEIGAIERGHKQDTRRRRMPGGGPFSDVVDATPSHLLAIITFEMACLEPFSLHQLVSEIKQECWMISDNGFTRERRNGRQMGNLLPRLE